MYTPYDENEKLWGSLDVNESIKAEKSIGQHILDELAKHDSKIAQVNQIKFLNFSRFNIFGLIPD